MKADGLSVCSETASSDGETTVLKEFEGDYSENYLRSGDWLLNKNTLEVYHIMTGESHTLSLSGTSGFVPDLFETDGSHIFMRGVSANAAAIVLGSMDGTCGCYHNEIFSRVFAPAVLTDGSVMVSVAADDAGSSYSIKIFGVRAAVCVAAPCFYGDGWFCFYMPPATGRRI